MPLLCSRVIGDKLTRSRGEAGLGSANSPGAGFDNETPQAKEAASGGNRDENIGGREGVRWTKESKGRWRAVWGMRVRRPLVLTD